MKKCSHQNCDLEVENNDKCTFHCEKDDWFTINEKNIKIWDEKKVDKFWKEVRKYIKDRQDNYQWIYFFESFIFPDITIDILNKPTNEDKILIKDFYFWEEGSDLKLEGLVSFKNCSFYDFLFYEIIVDSISFKKIKAEVIKLSNMEIKSLYFDKINDELEIELDNINITESCSFGDLNIDYLALHNVKFEDMTIRASNFYSAIFSNIRINNGLFINSTIDNIWSSHGFHIENKDTFTYLNMDVKKADREYFRLFKNYFFDKKDYINGNEMYQKEMDTYLLGLWKNVTKRRNLIKNIQDIIVTAFGKYSSNFGQSWLMPLLWIIIFLFLKVYLPNDCTLSYWFSGYAYLWDKISEQFYILLDLKASGLWDLLSKTLLGLLVYQLTVAIKRKTKY